MFADSQVSQAQVKYLHELLDFCDPSKVSGLSTAFSGMSWRLRIAHNAVIVAFTFVSY